MENEKNKKLKTRVWGYFLANKKKTMSKCINLGFTKNAKKNYKFLLSYLYSPSNF